MNALEKLPLRRMTVPEFLSWAATTDGAWQLRDGEPEQMDPASSGHAGVQAELTYLLTSHLRAVGDEIRVAIAPGVIPRVQSERTILVPDIALTSTPLSATHGVIDPIVLIEILSPSNERQTRANVWAFSTIPSVTEIVLLSSVEIAAEIYRRNPDGHWPKHPELVGSNGMLNIACIGFAVPLRDAYRTTDLVSNAA